MKKYIFFFQKKLDGIYRPLLGSDSYIQVDARRNLLSDSEENEQVYNGTTYYIYRNN